MEEQRVLDALASEHPDEAILLLPAAVNVRAAQSATEPAAAATAIDDLGAAVFEGAGGSEAATTATEAAFQRALEVRKTAFGEDGAETAKSYSTLSTFAFLRGRWDDAETLERRALAIRRASLPAGDLAIASSLDGLGVVYVRQGRLADAETRLPKRTDRRIDSKIPSGPSGRPSRKPRRWARTSRRFSPASRTISRDC
jgi:hypothetical protein